MLAYENPIDLGDMKSKVQISMKIFIIYLFNNE